MNIIKTGTIDADIVEANPIVFRDRLYIFEYVRGKSTTKNYYGNQGKDSYFRFLDVISGEFTPPFAHGLHMGSAFVWEGQVYVTAVEDWGKSRFYIMSSSDLANWSEPQVILEHPEWKGYNTTLCRARDKFILSFELGAPLSIVKTPFTMFFAESTDLINFKFIPDAVLAQDIYTGAPMLRYFGNWFYFFHLGGSYEDGFLTQVARSNDLKNWTWSTKNVLAYSDEDRLIAPEVPTDAPWFERVATAENINTSDLDMTDFNGNVEFVYSWGNQRGIEFLARGVIKNTTEAEFCRSFF